VHTYILLLAGILTFLSLLYLPDNSLPSVALYKQTS
jgi:hypothetical protein